MEDILYSLCWESSENPSPGSHSSLPDDDVLPWQCLSEVIPGLYLTCESEVTDKEKCLRNGNVLVINLCGEPHVTKYRVYEKNASGCYECRRFEDQSAFYAELNRYCQEAPSVPLEARKLFIVTIPAEDNPTYNMDMHFLECAVLIELVLRARKADERCEAVNHTAVPSVVVHCMVGVSRSAAVVIAYMMKKFNMSRDEAIHFIRCTRPVIQPNPGFQRQLELWESLKGFRVANEMSEMVLSAETKAKANVLDVVATILPTILRTNKCDSERRFFGVLIRNVSPSADEQHAIYRELRSIVTADVDCEVYTDIPNYFGYVAEVVCSVDTAIPLLMEYASFLKTTPTYNDSFYYRVAKDVARSGFEKDTFDTVRGFCSLFDAIHLKHLCVIGDGHPRMLCDGTDRARAPCGCSLSFPFLFLVAPYAEGFVQYSEWDALAAAFPTTGAALTAEEEQKLTAVVLDIFLQFFFRSSCGSAGTATSSSNSADVYTKLAYLQEDMELVTFCKLEELLRSKGTVVSVEIAVSTLDTNEAQVTLLLLLKAISGVVAFRIVLEAAERFITQTYFARLSSEASVADKRFALPVLEALVADLDSAFSTRFGVPANIAEFFKGELAGLRDNGVLSGTGVVSLFNT